MTMMLINGAYVKDAQGDLQTVEYTDRLFQDAVLMISAQRERFYPDKNFGNRVGRKLGDRQLLAYARQAVSNLDGVCIKAVQRTGQGIEYTIIVQDEERQVIFADD